ncbi:xylose isomerase [Gilliamella sp. wkB171]|uniref:xylose isomerase n=1 Tax=Gilliamella sp. wkB171 TaxID=3120258 RepID=UPI000813AC2F|nr:xylose isomerase [Gilliamella apicola]OCL16362.1 xylose isomerase [Gilliamella apicola]
MNQYYDKIDRINYEGTQSDNPFAFRHYDPNQIILGKTMAEHLRFSICYWHTFCWAGTDMFGSGSFDYPWQKSSDPLINAKAKAEIAFEFFYKMNVPFYAFHDVDVSPEGNSIQEYINNLSTMTDILLEKQQQTGVNLLWGTANCFTNPKYAAGAATNPDPEVFACAATQVVYAMNATHKLGGQNYVLWGGREGYETLLNTDLRKERQQLGKFMQLVVENKHKIGFKGALLIEPKPQEPTKHQYDYDVATIYGFLKQFGLENEIKVNIEANHATLAGHSFQHEVASAISLDIFGSLDANRGDPQLGWDTDQFPNSVEENTLVMYEILKSGGFKTGGLNFDAKIRRQSVDKYDVFYGHIGAIDTMALSLKSAAKMLESQTLSQCVTNRYAGWDKQLGNDILQGKMSLQQIAEYSLKHKLQPKTRSGEQEKLENLVNKFIFG